MGKQLNASVKNPIVEPGQNISYDLALVLFEEDNVAFCFCPALDITGYGDSEKEARKSFDITLREYFDYTVKEKTLKKDLTRLGWHFSRGIKRKAVPPQFSELINKDEDFKRIIDTYPVKTIHKSIVFPVFA